MLKLLGVQGLLALSGNAGAGAARGAAGSCSYVRLWACAGSGLQLTAGPSGGCELPNTRSVQMQMQIYESGCHGDSSKPRVEAALLCADKASSQGGHSLHKPPTEIADARTSFIPPY